MSIWKLFLLKFVQWKSIILYPPVEHFQGFVSMVSYKLAYDLLIESIIKLLKLKLSGGTLYYKRIFIVSHFSS